MTVLSLVLPLLVSAADPVPAPDDVKAGWLALVVFLLLAVAVAVLGWSLTRHLKRASRNNEAGKFGPVEDRPTETHDSPTDRA